MSLHKVLIRAAFRISLLSFCSLALQADVQLPALLSDHMVLQQDRPVRIWGKADPGENVRVAFRGGTVSTQAEEDGRWELFLPPSRAGGPFEMRVSGDNSITIRDILVGEVWVGSGQSNMVWPVSRSNNAEQEIAAADYPEIRLFQVKLTTAPEPRDDVEGSWKVCRPETVEDFSAVAYFFGRDLHKELGVPFGLIQSAWGGTPAQAWTSFEALDENENLRRIFDIWSQVLADYPHALKQYEKELAEWEAADPEQRDERRPRRPMGPGHPHAPATLYNAMIAPLTPYAIRGAIWYQGENNAHRGQGYLYRPLFKTMIQDWRRRWGQGEFPFLFVQLANYARVPEGGQWPELREAQLLALQLRKTAMAVTTDIGESQDIHPKNKQDVGRRLALGARAMAYGQDIVYSGPIYRQMSKHGNKIRVWLDHVSGGLEAKGGRLKGFTIAGSDREFHPAEARIEGKTVVVASAEVEDPVAVRYGWANDPKEANLYNVSGLPASPFRTDDWRGPRSTH